MDDAKTNPAAVAQIKNARANTMGQMTPKPKTVLKVTSGPIARGSGIRIVKGYVESGEDFEGYGGNKHRHLAPPKNIMQHLAQNHGWDEGDFDRAANAAPTESPAAFEKTLRGHHAQEHAGEPRGHTHYGGYDDNPGPTYHHEHPMTDIAHSHAPTIPDELPDDIKNMKLDKSSARCAKCGHAAAWHDRGLSCSHVECAGGDRVGLPSRCPTYSSEIPDALPSDIKNMKLDKSAADECAFCKEESADEAAHKMAAAHTSISPGDFAEKAVHEGVHSGLVSPKGDIYAEKGYAHHGAICNKAGIKHAYGALVRKHGWARLTGTERGSEHVGIDIRHNMGSRTRDAVSDVGMYTEGHGGRLAWDCPHPDGYHGGTDYSSLAHHLNRLQNSFAKGRGVWLRTQIKGFEGRPMSLKRTKRGLAFRKSEEAECCEHHTIDDGCDCKVCRKNPLCRRKVDVPDRLPPDIHKSVRLVVLVKSMSDVRSIKRFTAKHVKPEHWDAADNWLHGAKQTIEERTGGTPITHEGIQIGRAPTREHVAQGLAAMSPRQGWGTGAFSFDKVHARETVGNSDNRGIGLGNSVRRTRTALRGGGMGSGRSGKKTRALADLIQGGSSIPIDVHADRVVHYGRKADHTPGLVSGRRHDEHADAFRTAATDLGHEPRRHFVATWLAARDWKEKKGNTGIRAARANEDSAGQPNVLRHTGLWPGSKRDPKLLMNSKTVWESEMTKARGYKMPAGHPHETEAYSAHDLLHRGARNIEQGFMGNVSLHDWGRSRYAEARHLARMHGLSVTPTRDRSNPMKQHFELTPTANVLPHHETCKRGCPGYEE